MIAVVAVGWATSRPPTTQRFSLLILEAKDELDAELLACQWVAGRKECVMPTESKILRLEKL